MKIYNIIVFSLLLCCTGCLKEEKESLPVRIQMVFPEELQQVDKSGVNVKLFNTITGLTYNVVTDASGVAVSNVEYGFYEAIAQKKYHIGSEVRVVNGRIENMILTPENGDNKDFYSMNLISAVLPQLVIKEIYYAGCLDDMGNNYNKDTYISIYNNSSEEASLDSLCIGCVNPLTSASKSTFVKEDGSLMDQLPLAYLAWQVPSGSAKVLKPGEEVIIAINAVNHAQRAGNSVNLAVADYAFWDSDLTKEEVPAPGVVPLYKFWKEGTSTAFSVSQTGPAMILFKIKGTNAAEFAGNPDNLMKDPAKPNVNTRYLMIPSDWVVDGVECVISQTQANKRLTTNVDAGFIFIENRNQGLAVVRKVESIEGGRVVYMDTNNSSEDFEIKSASLKQ